MNTMYIMRKSWLFRRLILLGAGAVVAGSAIAAPAALPRGGSGTLRRTPAPQPRGGSGSLGGYRTWAVDLDVKQGVRYRLEQRLERLPKGVKEDEDRSAGRTAGELRLDVQPADAFVDLDGRFLGMASLLRGSAALHRIPIGHHTLR